MAYPRIEFGPKDQISAWVNTVPPRYKPNAYALDPFQFGRGGCLWTMPEGGNATQLAGSVIQHAHSLRWTALIDHNVLGFCREHEIQYHRFRDVLRGDVLMRDEDRAFVASVFGPDAVPEARDITDLLRDATEDTRIALLPRVRRRKFNEVFSPE